MTSPDGRVARAEKAAAAWHGRLGGRVVSSEDVREFFEWRQDPVNADAYRRVETIWGRTAALRDDPEFLAELERLRTPPARTRGRVGAGWALGAVCAVLVAVAAATVWLGRPAVFATAVGEDRLVRLDDGSTIRLDTASTVRVRYDGARRLIDLEGGQALFTVAHEARPFIVRAAGAEVRALGTVFDVRRDGEAVSVVLVSGKVAVTPEGDEASSRGLLLSAGQKAVVAEGRAVARPVDLAVATAWTEGRLTFRDTPLDEAVAEVNRYLPRPVVLAAPGLSEVPVNGVFVAGDRDAFVSAVVELFDLERETRPDGGVRLVAAS